MEIPEIKLFNKWTTQGIEVKDPGLKRYIQITPRIVPKTGARYAKDRFHKSEDINIVERLINKIMVAGHRAKKHKISSGHMTGKASHAYNTVEEAFKKIEEKTKQNPFLVFVKAIENAAPREEVVAIEYGGARYPKAVECAPQRRIDLVLRWMTQEAYDASFKKKKKLVDAITDSILTAYKNDKKSRAISKKFELERQADASR